MEPLYYVWFLIFALVLYFITVDKNVAQYYILITKIAELWYRRAKWWILYNPRNPIVKYMIWRRSFKMAEKLQKSIKKDANSIGKSKL